MKLTGFFSIKAALIFFSFLILIVFALFAYIAIPFLIGPPNNEITTEDRIKLFAELPQPSFNKPVKIYWNEYQIPFIHAEDDQDAAFALGLVHAHLRLGQMELAKRIAAGRLSEMLGPIYLNDIDAALRALGFGRAANEIYMQMPESSRQWLDAYVAGVNYYKNNVKELPYEHELLNLQSEPWTAIDSITLGRVGGSDINWAGYFLLLPYYGTEAWNELWNVHRNLFENSKPGFDPETYSTVSMANRNSHIHKHMIHGLFALSKSGSNSVVVAPEKSKTGAALIANDPHLGVGLPNFWLIAGLKSPSYHIVGMSAPGTPVFAFGRTPDIAWGGTNMRSWNSDLIDITGKETEYITDTEKHILKTRWWLDKQIENRVSSLGPVISDVSVFPAPEGKTYALRWVGHLVSDEITALLNAAKARDGQELREALQTFALPGQNMLFADRSGDIGHIIATWVPGREKGFPEDIIVPLNQAVPAWQNIFRSTELPYLENPKSNFIVSANNIPVKNTSAPLGWYISADDRFITLQNKLQEKEHWDIDSLKKLQQDTYSASNVELRDELVNSMEAEGFEEKYKNIFNILKSWDGYYAADSQGALVLEGMLDGLLPEVYRINGQTIIYDTLKSNSSFAGITAVQLSKLSSAEQKQVLSNALEKVEALLREKKSWGDIHHMRVQHYFGNIPVIGHGFIFDEYPTGGNNETIMKTGHETTMQEHTVTYGSQARHISDMGDINANFFSLIGGQDGWFGSENFMDQVALWREGELIQIPLDIDVVQQQFPMITKFPASQK